MATITNKNLTTCYLIAAVYALSALDVLGFGGTCSGTPRSCSSRLTSESCASDGGCTWYFHDSTYGIVDGQCSGSASPCSSYTSRLYCEDYYQGCHWEKEIPAPTENTPAEENGKTAIVVFIAICSNLVLGCICCKVNEETSSNTPQSATSSRNERNREPMARRLNELRQERQATTVAIRREFVANVLKTKKYNTDQSDSTLGEHERIEKKRANSLTIPTPTRSDDDINGNNKATRANSLTIMATSTRSDDGINGSNKASMDQCAICLEEFRDGQQICSSHNKNCNHVFHRECVSEWLQEHEDCPCCRRNYLSFESIRNEDDVEAGRRS